jgi:hypothetical protein
MKKFITLLLIPVMIIGTFGFFPSYAKTEKVFTSQNQLFKYTINSEEGATIVECFSKADNLKIPDEIDGYKVTRIRQLHPIGKKTNLCKPKIIKFGRNVRVFVRLAGTIEKFVVDKENPYYTSQNGVLFNKKMTKLVRYPVCKSATKYTIPASVKSIGTGAFMGAQNLKKVVYNKSIKKIGEWAFDSCPKLRAAIIPKSVTYIGSEAFEECTELSKLRISGSSKLFIGYHIVYNCKSLKELTMPLMSEKSIPEEFAGSGIKSIIITKNIKSIPDGCFLDCKKLSSVTVPCSVEKIGKQAFGYIWGDYVIEKDKNFELKGKKGSAAEKYAKANKLKFKAI